ncbi:MAG: hypothetical protein ED559_09405 [Phycisphaera sp.]|nr:MAG: hypothetical protein ED559_09405 [Phycisphaera sp.]
MGNGITMPTRWFGIRLEGIAQMRIGQRALQFVTSCIAITACAASAQAQPGFGEAEEHSRVSLISETETIAPDTSTMLAFEFNLDKSYHTYADSYNDSGAPLITVWAKPTGVEIGDPIWPAPYRYEQPGGVLDHVYERRLFLMMPVSIDPSTPIGEEIVISASLEWLVCDSNLCVPQYGEVSTTLNVASRVKPSEHAQKFADARDSSGKLLTGARSDAVIVMWEGDTLVLSNLLGYGMSFIPAAESAEPLKLMENGRSDSGTLRIDFDFEESDRVVGWVRLHKVKGNPGAPVNEKLWIINVKRGSKPNAFLGNSESESQ